MKVSIIIPSFNQGIYILRALDSIYSQNYPNLEVILVDGGSNDNTLELVQNYHRKLDIVISEKDRGQSDAINKGLKLATGDVVGWLNSDDMLEADCINFVVSEFLSDAELGFVYGNIFLIDGLDNSLRILRGAQVSYPSFLYRLDLPIPQQGSFWRKSIVDEMPYFLNLDFHFVLDRDLFIRTCLHTKVRYLDKTLGRFRLHGESKSVSKRSAWLQEMPLLYNGLIGSISNRGEELKSTQIANRVNGMLNLFFCLEFIGKGDIIKSSSYLVKALLYDFLIIFHSGVLIKFRSYIERFVFRSRF